MSFIYEWLDFAFIRYMTVDNAGTTKDPTLDLNPEHYSYMVCVQIPLGYQNITDWIPLYQYESNLQYIVECTSALMHLFIGLTQVYYWWKSSDGRGDAVGPQTRTHTRCTLPFVCLLS